MRSKEQVYFEISLFFLFDCFLSSSDKTSSSGGNKSYLDTWWCVSGKGTWVTNMLLVTSSVGMVYGVHSHTSHSWPVLSLRFVLVEDSSSFKDWFVGSSSSGDDSNHGSAVSRNGSSAAGWESESGLPSLVDVADDDG